VPDRKDSTVFGIRRPSIKLANAVRLPTSLKNTSRPLAVAARAFAADIRMKAIGRSPAPAPKPALLDFQRLEHR